MSFSQKQRTISVISQSFHQTLHLKLHSSTCKQSSLSVYLALVIFFFSRFL
eukprot:UN06315